MLQYNKLLELKSEFRKVLKPHYEFIRDNHINIFICGSSSLDFISNPRNIDLYITYIETNPYESDDKSAKAIKAFIESFKEKNNSNVTVAKEGEKNIWCYLYANNFINLLGVDELYFTIFDLPDLGIGMIRELYDDIRSKQDFKRLYNIVYYYYIRKNHRYHLDEAQKKSIDYWHDEKYDFAWFKQVTDYLGLPEQEVPTCWKLKTKS